MNKTKISNHQLFALVANFTLGTTVISISSNVVSLAHQDAWISALISIAIGIPFIWMYYYIGKLYPGKSLIDILNAAFGKWAGWILSAIFVVFVCYLDTAQVIFYVGNFIRNEYMTETPLYALNLLLAIGIVIGMLYGLEAIARAAEGFIVIVSVLIIFSLLLNMKNIEPLNLLPIFEKGIVPILKGAFSLSSYMTWPLVILLMIVPTSTDNTIKTRNSLFAGYLWGATINFLCTIMSLMVLGSTITARSEYPAYMMAKEISVGIIDRIEGIISFSWLVTEFIRILLYFYAGTLGLAQLFRIKDYKKLIMPLGLVMLMYSGVVYPNAAYQAKWDTTTWVPFIATFGVILPILILIIKKFKDVSRQLK
ncbi:MAG: endospore germination permease [Ignavibacteriaceae bacterium]|nr:endospore germination permease [Ignavibacteriaceae bacterium]